MAEPKTEVDRRFDRVELAIGTMAQWLVQAQTGFNAKDAEGIEAILRGEYKVMEDSQPDPGVRQPDGTLDPPIPPAPSVPPVQEPETGVTDAPVDPPLETPPPVEEGDDSTMHPGDAPEPVKEDELNDAPQQEPQPDDEV